MMALAAIRTVFGTMEFGRRLNLKDSITMANAFYNFQKAKGPVEMDTAFMYDNGRSEEFIGQMELRLKSNVEIATKANPWDNKLLNADGVRKQLETSLKRLQLNSVQIFYLHAPDHRTPIIETLKAVNDLYEEKKFKEFGLSNYAAWQVAEIFTICKIEGWIQPSVYQGMYSALTRSVEKELFPCLRHFGLRFYAYSPLCGGMLTGKHKLEDSNKTEPGRFFEKGYGERYQQRYWHKEIFYAINKIQKVLLEVYNNHVGITEASLRWIYYHSKLDGSCGDCVILGASSMNQFNQNKDLLDKGPLDENVIAVFEECWNDCCFLCPDYMR